MTLIRVASCVLGAALGSIAGSCAGFLVSFPLSGFFDISPIFPLTVLTTLGSVLGLWLVWTHPAWLARPIWPFYALCHVVAAILCLLAQTQVTNVVLGESGHSYTTLQGLQRTVATILPAASTLQILRVVTPVLLLPGAGLLLWLQRWPRLASFAYIGSSLTGNLPYAVALVSLLRGDGQRLSPKAFGANVSESYLLGLVHQEAFAAGIGILYPLAILVAMGWSLRNPGNEAALTPDP